MGKLRLIHKLLGLSGFAAAVLALVTYVSHRSLDEADQSGRLVSANAAQRAQMDADMMHDAIRADVQLIQISAPAKEKEALKEGIAGIREHTERIQADLKEVGESPEPEVAEAEKKMTAAIQGYVDQALAFARAAEATPDQLPPADKFQQAFEELETLMGELGDTIEKTVGRIAEEAKDAKAHANRTNLTVSTVCAVGLLVLSLVLVRSILQPLRAMADAARRVSGGDVDQRIDYESEDEVGELASALRSLIDYIQGIARAADALGRGDLAVNIAARGPSDALSSSFIEMKRNLGRLVEELSVLIQAARRGDLSARSNAEEFSGAFREMIEGAGSLLGAVGAPLNEAKEVLRRVEGRDLGARMHGEYQGDYAAIKVSLNSAVETLERTIGEVSSVADQVASAAQQITASSSSSAETASMQVSTIQQITNELETTTSMSKQSASDAQNSRTAAQAAMSTAEQGSQNMARLSAAVEAMKGAADETAKIVRTIDEIAFQTNLLALNAAVEAARAGDAGRGFAVVADEVRTLAMRSAEAARNTTQVIERSLKQAEEGVSINRAATVAFDAIATQVKKIAQGMGDIAESSMSQHAAVARVSASAESIRGGAQSGAAAAEQTAAAAEELSAQAQAMHELTAQFRLNGSSGKNGIKSPVRSPAVKSPRARAAEIPTDWM